jgi:hypothetical protein
MKDLAEREFWIQVFMAAYEVEETTVEQAAQEASKALAALRSAHIAFLSSQ